MAGAIDIVCNLFTPDEVRSGQTGLDEQFKAQVRMPEEIRGGVTIEDYLGKMDRAGIERSLLIAVRAGDINVRGSFEIPYERVPIEQKRIVQAAIRAGRPAITATQMLQSMVGAPRPTRAEITDVANAVLDGTDAVMLSDETAVGVDPVRACRAMSRIIDLPRAATA